MGWQNSCQLWGIVTLPEPLRCWKPGLGIFIKPTGKVKQPGISESAIVKKGWSELWWNTAEKWGEYATQITSNIYDWNFRLVLLYKYGELIKEDSNISRHWPFFFELLIVGGFLFRWRHWYHQNHNFRWRHWILIMFCPGWHCCDRPNI